jgi:sulfane dehydrogenase subunit SoxC
MDSNRSGRRRFLEQGAALAGLAVGAGWPASAQEAGAAAREVKPKGPYPYGAPSRFVTVGRTNDYSKGVFQGMFGPRQNAPLQDVTGNITPAAVHFVRSHSTLPDTDPQQYRLLIHGMVDRPLSFSLDELKRLPSETRIHFLECQGNSSPGHHGHKKFEYATVQDLHGATSCSEWTGVPLSVLLKETGLQKGGNWLVSEGADAGRYTYTLPLAKALDDVMVVYGQNGEPVRPDQGYPVRLLVPGWEGPYSVKWLRQIKVVDQPYMAWDEAMQHSISRPDLGEKARWYHFEMPVKSLITRPSGGQKLPGKGFYEISGLAWSGAGLIRRVEVTTDGGKTWKDAKIQGPVHRKAHTRFTFPWTWDGGEAMIASRSTDERGDVQPSIEELSKHWGIPSQDSWEHADHAFHFNAIQRWRVTSDGSIHDAMFAS